MRLFHATVFSTIIFAAPLASQAQESFSYGEVNQAIDKGVAFLLSRQQADGSWPDADGGRDVQEADRQIGLTSLVTYALLAKGLGIKEPHIAKSIHWLERQRSQWVYALSLRCQVWLHALAQDRRYEKYLRRDSRELIDGAAQHQRHKGAYTYRLDNLQRDHAYDNSNSQYAVLGAWAAKRAGIEIPNRYWQLVGRHWTSEQEGDGGWRYRNGDQRGVLGSMTAAGLASLYVCVDASLGGQMIHCGKDNDIAAIKKGLQWFDRNFAETMRNRQKALGHGNLPYYLYGVERVGLASGYKYFGKADWYKMGATWLLKNQGKDGGWSGGRARDYDTAYALLFLIRGLKPMLFNRLEYQGDWNNRPRALANFCRWAGQAMENELNWQIVTLQSPVEDWHDAPIITITGSQEPKFTPQDIQKLRDYVYQGGTILSICECKGKAFSEGMEKLYKELFPTYELAEAGPDHPLYSVYYKLGGSPKFETVSNGVRPLAIHIEQDVALSWQQNQYATQRKMFEFGLNILLYVTDRQLYNRGSKSWPADTKLSSPAFTLKVARLKYSGNYDPEPLAWEAISRKLAKHNNIQLDVTAPLEIAKLKEANVKLAVITGTSSLNLSDEEKTALQAFVKGGGTLLIESAGGNREFSTSVESFLKKAFPDRLLDILPPESPLYNSTGTPIGDLAYSRNLAKKTRNRGPRLLGMLMDKRVAVIVSPEDLTESMIGVGVHDVEGYRPESTVKLMQYITTYVNKQ